MVRNRFPIVMEPEASGTISAYVVGLPVYAQGPTPAKAEQAIRRTLAAYLEAHPDTESSRALIRVASVQCYRRQRPAEITISSAASLIATGTSRRKAAAARANGLLGGRPRKTASAR